MNRRALHVTAAAVTLFGTLFAAAAWLKPAPRLLWNASASAPTGLYRIDVGARPRRGDLVAIAPPPALAAFLAERGYLPQGVPLLKRVAAPPGALVCRSGVFVTVDGVGAVRALTRDRANRPLPIWTGCRTVGRGELFLVNAARDSLDGRYFGPVSDAGLIGTAQPVLTRVRDGAPLRWHLAGLSGAPSIPKQESE
ncbi:S26 family signal peptidase [Sphingopyxis sp. 550A]